MVEKV